MLSSQRYGEGARARKVVVVVVEVKRKSGCACDI